MSADEVAVLEYAPANSAPRRLSPILTALVLTVLLVGLVVVMHRITDGFSSRMFAYGSDGSFIQAYYVIFAFLSFALLPWNFLIWYFSDRASRFGYWAFALPTVAIWLLQMVLLSMPFSGNIQYMIDMGYTPSRLSGLACGATGYVVILGFLVLVLRRPR